jgi:hypothetical protein
MHKRHGLFSVTSNVDGHWMRAMQQGEAGAAGTPCESGVVDESDRVYEVHGSVTHMQLMHPSPSFSLLAQNSGIDGAVKEDQLCGPVWRAQAGRDYAPMLLNHTDSAEEASVAASVAAASPLPSYPHSTETVLQAMQAAAPGAGSVADDLLVEKDKQEALSHALRARPNVLMFGDPHWDWTRSNTQGDHFDRWKDGLAGSKDSKICIIEIGAGQSVSTIRDLAQSEAATFKDATLVRINYSVEDSLIPECVADYFSAGAHSHDGTMESVSMKGRSISIGGLGALEALRRIDQHIAPSTE